MAVNHSLQLERSDMTIRPWRIAVLSLLGVAAVELVLLVMAGGALLAKPGHPPPGAARKPASTHKTGSAAKPRTASSATSGASSRTTAVAASLPRRKVGIVVLNGNGRQGAAGAIASRASGRGYRIRTVANAPSADYPRSIVMYRPGFAPEGRRLARDLGIGVVGPLDGMRPSQLHGAHAVLILGG
jgi:hypothetical protein